MGITYTPGGTLTYGYDNDRRIISRGGSLFQSILPPAVSSASYNHDNQLTYFSTGAASPTYDLNGNLVSDGINTYSWDARNRLTGISSGPSFSYDGVNRRQSFASSGTTTGYLYDGLNPVEEFQGASVHATLLTGLGIDERFSRTESGTTSTFLTDQLGSTVALAASNGAIATNYGYDAQGNTTVTGIASDSSYQFTGRENDGDGLDYYRARYYNPIWGRFIQEDPIGFKGGTDVYAYAGGNPISFGDPTGLCPTDPKKCENLAQKITKLRNELAKRSYELDNDPLGLPPTGPMSVAGHQQQFQNKQTQLRNLLSQYDSDGCNDGDGSPIPPDAWAYATMSTPGAPPFSPFSAGPSEGSGGAAGDFVPEGFAP